MIAMSTLRHRVDAPLSPRKDKITGHADIISSCAPRSFAAGFVGTISRLSPSPPGLVLWGKSTFAGPMGAPLARVVSLDRSAPAHEHCFCYTKRRFLGASPRREPQVGRQHYHVVRARARAIFGLHKVISLTPHRRLRDKAYHRRLRRSRCHAVRPMILY